MNVRAYQGNAPAVHASAYVDSQACVIGDVVVGADCSVWPMAVLRGDVNHIRIGARTSVQDGTVIHVTHDYAARPGGNPVHIGDEVTIGHRVVLHGCTVGNRCLIGSGAVILDGAVVHDLVLVGAASLVTEGKVLESGHLYHGSPARRIRPLSEAELNYFAYAAAHYVRLKDAYKAGGN